MYCCGLQTALALTMSHSLISLDIEGVLVLQGRPGLLSRGDLGVLDEQTRPLDSYVSRS